MAGHDDDRHSGARSPNHRTWGKETRYLVEDIGRFLTIGPESSVLDYGCGTGRIAKVLIERYGCHVVGIDTSPSLRSIAPRYVRSERFTVSSPETWTG